MKKIATAIVLFLFWDCAFCGQLKFIGNTTPGGVLARRHAKRVRDAVEFFSSHLSKTERRLCFGSDSIGVSTSLSPGLKSTVSQLVENIASEKSITGGIGYLYSSEAILAAAAARKSKFPLVSPAVTLDSLFHQEYFRSLGLSVREQARIIVYWIKKEKIAVNGVAIVVQVDQIFSLSLFKWLKFYLSAEKIATRAIKIISSDRFYVKKVVSEIRSGNERVVAFANYWSSAFPILKESVPSEKIIFGNSEWVYNEDLMGAGLKVKNRILMVADFAPQSVTVKISNQQSKTLYEINRQIADFSNNFYRRFQYYPTALVFSVVDTLGIMCKRLSTNPNVKRDEFLNLVFPKNPYLFVGLKGLYKVSNGILERSVFISEWKDSKFITISESKARM